jgi:hypothetical protein
LGKFRNSGDTLSTLFSPFSKSPRKVPDPSDRESSEDEEEPNRIGEKLRRQQNPQLPVSEEIDPTDAIFRRVCPRAWHRMRRERSNLQVRLSPRESVAGILEKDHCTLGYASFAFATR